MRPEDKPTTPPFPDISKLLLDELNRRFPERCPDPDQPGRAVWMAAGARGVVRFLNEQYRRQTENT